MKILVFDIGGTAIKYGICQDGHLMETSECPTEAYKGGPHILETICTLAEQSLPFDAIGISVTTMGSVGPGFGIAGATCTYSGLSDFSKSILCISMMLGRLEMFTLLVMLCPSFWRLRKSW